LPVAPRIGFSYALRPGRRRLVGPGPDPLTESVPVNILLITLDQFRGDCLSCAGHPVVRTPHLDRLAAGGVRLARHYSQAAPCGPGRACHYTGTYQMNNRVVGNGTPLDHRFDNVARAARRAGYRPVLFGYADQAVDPRQVTGPDDPRLTTYQGVPPGFDVELDLPDEQDAWREWLAGLGYDIPGGGDAALASEPDRPAEHGVSAFLTDRLLAWLDHQDGPWFAHASYWRPHPPYAAAGRWARAYDPDAVDLPVPPSPVDTPPCGRLAADPAPGDEASVRALRAQYYGMISAVDEQLGRVWDALAAHGMWDDTMIVVTADHGEQLGDQGTIGKGGFFESSYHVVGIVRDPGRLAAHGTVVDEFTENVDLLPTLCEAMGVDIPAQCDGLPLTPFLAGENPPWWRDAAHWEYDWRWEYIPFGPHEWPWDRRLERKQLAVLRTAAAAYVQYGEGWSCAFDLAADPGWGTALTDPAAVLGHARSMLAWRSQHADRSLADTLVYGGILGRVPQAVAPA
jgi:arylsulfatase A-like enzyme